MTEPHEHGPATDVPWWRRHVVVAGAAGALVLALVAGLTAWLAHPAPAEARRNPFDRAVANLAVAPSVRYQGSDADASWDVRVTNHGEAVGTVTVSGEAVPLLTVDGRTFLKPPNGAMLFTAPSVPTGRWLTGPDITGDPTIGPVLGRLRTPEALANQLSIALSRAGALPSTTDPGTTVDGMPALMATTPAGDLYVTKNAPYRVLRLVGFGRTGPSTGAPPVPRLPALPGVPGVPVIPGLAGSGQTPASPTPTGTVHGASAPLPGVHPAAAPSATPNDPGANLGDLGSADFPEMTNADTDQLYQDLENGTGQLTDAVDSNVRFTITGNVNLQCGPGGCTVTANVNSQASAGAGATVTGTVTAELTATVTVDGIDAGGCTSTASMPVNSAGSIGCSDGAAGAVFQSELNAKRAAAQAQANAQAAITGYAEVPYEVDGYAEATVIASAQVDVQGDLQREKAEQQGAACAAALGTPNSFLPDTPVVLADGSARPIGEITPGTRVRALDPVTGRVTDEPVLARITGSGAKSLDRLTVAADGAGVTVTATTNHPFWDQDRRGWVDAGDLRVGDHLATDDGRAATVAATAPYPATLTVDNLTVADVHTYYVRVGGVDVLVHNAPKKFCGLRADKKGEDWRTKGFHVHMPNDDKEVSFYGEPRTNPKGEIVGYDALVRPSYNSPGKIATPQDLKLAQQELQSPDFRANILQQGAGMLDYLKQNYPTSGQIQGLEYLLKAIQEMR